MKKRTEENLKNIKYTAKAAINTLGMMAGVACSAIPIVGLPLGIGITGYNAIRFGKNLQGDYIKNSQFAVSSNNLYNKLFKHPDNYIAQDVLSLREVANGYRMKDKNTFFMTQTMNMLNQLKSKDCEGNAIEYNTTSHTMTRYFLKRLEKMGYVNIIEDIKHGQSKERVEDEKQKKDKGVSLLVPNLLLGNLEGIKKNLSEYNEKTYIKQGITPPKGGIRKLRDLREACKTDMYDMKFTTNGKKMSEVDFEKVQKIVLSLSKRNNIDKSSELDFSGYNINRDKDGNILSVVPKSRREIRKEKKLLKKSKEVKMLPSVDSDEILQDQLESQVYNVSDIAKNHKEIDKNSIGEEKSTRKVDEIEEE